MTLTLTRGTPPMGSKDASPPDLGWVATKFLVISKGEGRSPLISFIQCLRCLEVGRGLNRERRARRASIGIRGRKPQLSYKARLGSKLPALIGGNWAWLG
ncbi:hypothetical protein L2E82_17271 [Cichorium intybus]|uniref:Uncharacterized protein n=1 Tax=Cichorium intybus TaxID=13427 RepID=A0ACB9F7A2_CICIN|nr:hypothetical protein L2E82_17271 [Cichorium intybus]